VKRGEIAQRVTRGAFYLTVEKAAALLSGIAYFALLCRWLGPTKYGIMALALSIVGLATIATGNFEVFLERYAAEYQAHGAYRTLWRAHRLALGVKLALGGLTALVLMAISPWLAPYFHTPELALLVPVLALTVASDGMATTGRATLYGLQEFQWVSGLALAFHLAKTVTVALLWYKDQTLFQLAIGLTLIGVAHAVASAIVPAWIVRREMRATPATSHEISERDLLRLMGRYCAPLLGARITFIAGQNLSRVVLGNLFEAKLLGLFSFAFQTVERFVELVQTLPSSLMPSLTRLVANQERERLRFVFDQAHRLINVVACSVGFGLFVFAPEITRAVGSPLLAESVPLLRILGLVPIARTAQQTPTMLFQAMKRPDVTLGLALLKFVGEFGSYLFFIPWLGLRGAAWANLLGAVLSFLGSLWFLARALPEGREERRASMLTSWLVLVPLLLVGYLLGRWVPMPVSLVLRLLLIPIGLVTLFATGLVTRYDLEKLAGLPLRTAWSRRARDSFVASADRLAQAVAPRRST
jgi:O-antigen/teichoic acid export membrane protein